MFGLHLIANEQLVHRDNNSTSAKKQPNNTTAAGKMKAIKAKKLEEEGGKSKGDDPTFQGAEAPILLDKGRTSEKKELHIFS